MTHSDSSSGLVGVIFLKLLVMLLLLCNDVTEGYRITSSRFLNVNERVLKRKLNRDLNEVRESLFERYDMNEREAEKFMKDNREKYGKRNHWWGDLDALNTRMLYHNLIRDFEVETSCMSDSELYKISCELITKRLVAKYYSRERARVPVLLFSVIFDMLRDHGDCSAETIKKKYLEEMGLDTNYENVNNRELWEKIILKAQSTNGLVDGLVYGRSD